MSEHPDDLTNAIERIDMMEAHVGVRLEALFASVKGPDADNDYRVVVNGEVHAINGETIPYDIALILSAYDARGRVIKVESRTIAADTFFCFEVFSLDTYVNGMKPTKLRVYPKR